MRRYYSVTRPGLTLVYTNFTEAAWRRQFLQPLRVLNKQQSLTQFLSGKRQSKLFICDDYLPTISARDYVLYYFLGVTPFIFHSPTGLLL